MIRHDLSQWARALVLVVAGTAFAQAQGFGPNGFGGGGPPSPEESFRRIDRNGNDTIDPEEWETLPAGIRRAYEDLADLSRPMSYEDFADVSQKLREQMMSRFGGGRGADFGRGGGFGQREQSNDSAEGDDSPTDERNSRRRGGFGGGGFGSGGFGGFGGGRGFNGSDEDAIGTDNTGKKSEKTAKTRIPLNLKLPEQYRSRDKDRDGQIGLYEWSRSDYAGFQKLDRNGDGFLTPQELLRAGGRSSAPITAAASTGGGFGSGAASGAGAPPSAGPAPSNRAETAFKLLDKNNDASISEAEWKKSLSAGPTFEKAGIKVNLPLSRNEFLRLFPQAYPTAAK